MALHDRTKSFTAAERKISRIGVAGAILVLVASSVAQNRLEATPPVAGYGPTYDVSLGYSYLSSSIPSAGRVNLTGIEATGHADFLPHWGVAIDSGYVRTSNVLDTGHTGYTLTFLAGPVFYPIDHGRTKAFLHALAGAGLVDSAVPATGSSVLHGWVERPAYALGGGVEREVLGPFGLRLSGDYLRTAFANSSGAIQLQNNLRVTASFVFRLNHLSHGE
jgi:hypothetical protein